jgi:hypothetical protein
MGLSRTAVGPQSDGLVQIKNATVNDAPTAYVHRAHSGRYGIVNSEEGFQNLERFFFGDLRVQVGLAHADLLLDINEEGVSHQAEVQLSIRGLPTLMHDQSISHHSPILITQEDRKKIVKDPNREIPLFTTFLMSELAPQANCRYAIRLAVHELRQERGGFLNLQNHLEQVPLWNDHLVVDVKSLRPREEGYRGKYAWRSQQKDPTSAPKLDVNWDWEGKSMRVKILLPEPARKVLGEDAALIMRASEWE